MGRGLQNGREGGGGQVKVYPYTKGGGDGKYFYKQFWGSFNTVVLTRVQKGVLATQIIGLLHKLLPCQL